MKYFVTRSGRLRELETQINALLKDGYTLQGGVAVVYTPLGVEYFQAMIKTI